MTDLNAELIIRKLTVKLERQKQAVAETEQHINAMRSIAAQKDLDLKPKK